VCYTGRNNRLFNAYQLYFINFIVKLKILEKLIFCGIDNKLNGTNLDWISLNWRNDRLLVVNLIDLVHILMQH